LNLILHKSDFTNLVGECFNYNSLDTDGFTSQLYKN
jgi:hypothetical protein